MQDGAQQTKTTRKAKPMYLNLIGPAALFVLVLVLYAPSMRNDFIYDDHQLILEQPTPRSAVEIVKVFGERHWYNLPYYRPVARATMVAQKFIHGDQAGPFHLFNACLIGIAALLAYALLRLPVFGIRPLPALLAAAIFAAHPVASSCVYPICSGRETLIPAIFTITALYCFLRPTRPWFVLALIGFAMALLSKEQAIVIPAIFVLADLSGLSAKSPGRNARQWLGRYIPVAGILVIYLVIRLLILGGNSEHHIAIFARPYGPLLTALYTIQTIFVPFVQLVYEPRPGVWFSAWRLLTALAATLLIIFAARKKWHKVKSATLFWLGLIVLSVLPTANILVQEAGFAERYGLLAVLGIVAIASTILSAAWEKTIVRQAATAAGIVLVIACGSISLHRCRYFANDSAFLEQWIRTDPKSPQPHASLGQAFYKQQNLDKAVEHYRKALEIDRANAETLTNLGMALAMQAKFDEAITQFERALMLKPDDAKTYNDMATAFKLKGDNEQAVSYYKLAIKTNPHYGEAYYNLAATLQSQGKFDQAVKLYKKTIELNPDNFEAHNNLGNILQLQGKLDQAVRCYEEVLRINPGYAKTHHNLAKALQSAGKTDQAIAQYEKALQIDPEYLRAYISLAGALQLQGKLKQATNQLQKALQIDPHNADIHNSAALVLAMTGRTKEAIRHFSEAARLKANWAPPLNSLAWLLATSPNITDAERAEAVSLAEHATELTQYDNPAALDTLAAAYAAAGQFEKAIETAQKAIKLATETGDEKTADQIKDRLALYEKGQPYHEPPPK